MDAAPLRMGNLAWILPFFSVIAGVCCVDNAVLQVSYNVKKHHIMSAVFEDEPGEGSCEWESPPENGFNFRSCTEGLCGDTFATHKRNGTVRFTRCNPHFVLVEGSDRDICLNGSWTSDEHRCSPCGRSQNTFNPYEDLVLIHNGHNSSRGDFPWMTAIYTRLDHGMWEQICGGTLISPTLVLSAAHCFVIAGRNLEAQDVRVGVGKLFRSYYQGEADSIIKSVKEIVRQERYQGVDHWFDLDIALLVLNQRVTTGKYIMPACMEFGTALEPKQDEVGYISGWGLTEPGGSPSPVLKWATQKYVQYDQCQTLIKPRDRKLVTHDKFCVAGVKDGRADKGDSGGALTILRDEVHYVYGVLSTKLLNDDMNVRLFTSVLNPSHLDWLLRQWRRIMFNETYVEPVVSALEGEQDTKILSRGSKSIEMCKKYSEHLYYKEVDDCEGDVCTYTIDTCSSFEPLIGDGSPIKTKAYPHMALIGSGLYADPEWMCAGSLISETYVLSAAICAETTKGLAKWVVLGGYSRLQSKDPDPAGESQPEQYGIIARIVHPDYNPPGLYNNIALFKLHKNVIFNEFMRPLCLHTDHDIPETFALATGWGYIEMGGDKSDVLGKINLTILDKNECENAYNSFVGPELVDGIRDESMLCATETIAGKHTCEGDTGGPVQFHLKEPYCMFSQVGVTAFGSLCGGSKPGIYTRVSRYVPWIESVVWPLAEAS